MKNGTFEEGMNSWIGFSYCPQLPADGVITDYRSYSGKSSIYTACGTGGEHCFGVGGGAKQQIQLSNISNLTCSLWVYPFGVSESNAYTNVAFIADFRVAKAEKTLVYYVAWADNIPIYRHYPTPTMNSENVSNILLRNLEIGKWNYIERNLEADFKKSFFNVNSNEIQDITITVVAVTFQRLSLTSIGAFWDDISVKHAISSPTPSLTPGITPSLTPSLTISPFSPTPVLPVEPNTTKDGLRGIRTAVQDYAIIILIILIIGTLVGILAFVSGSLRKAF